MSRLLLHGVSQLEQNVVIDAVASHTCCDVLVVQSVDQVAMALAESHFAALLVFSRGELRSSQIECIELAKRHRIPCIGISDRSITPEVRLQVIEAGAIDCLEMRSRGSRLRALLELFVSRAEIVENHLSELPGKSAQDHVVLNSPRMKTLLRQLSRVASLSSTVLLTGETGVGKTTLARWLHENSDRRDDPFLAIPCAAIPPSLLESELFGHARGAFTGADRDQVGKFLSVGSGTILLDEVDCFPMELQAKLLRVVEQRLVEPVGSSKSLKVAARFVAASNRPLEDLVAAGQFRADLYYRLKVLSFDVPPLRDCPESVLALANHFCTTLARQMNRPVDGISPSAKHALTKHRWAGNIRELKNAMESAVALAEGSELQWCDLPESVRRSQTEAPVSIAPSSAVPPPPCAAKGNRLQDVRDDAERRMLIEALQRNKQNRSRTAEELGISRVTLYKRMHRLGVNLS